MKCPLFYYSFIIKKFDINLIIILFLSVNIFGPRRVGTGLGVIVALFPLQDNLVALQPVNKVQPRTEI